MIKLTYLCAALILSSISVSSIAKDSSDSAACKAVISMEMSKSTSIIKTSMDGPNVYTVSYIRPSDGKLWRTSCRVNGNEVIWSSMDDSGSVGRPRSSYGSPWNDTQWLVTSDDLKAGKVTVCGNMYGEKTCQTVVR